MLRNKINDILLTQIYIVVRNKKLLLSIYSFSSTIQYLSSALLVRPTFIDTFRAIRQILNNLFIFLIFYTKRNNNIVLSFLSTFRRSNYSSFEMFVRSNNIDYFRATRQTLTNLFKSLFFCTKRKKELFLPILPSFRGSVLSAILAAGGKCLNFLSGIGAIEVGFLGSMNNQCFSAQKRIRLIFTSLRGC